ncbi:MAG TPA: hypothetical protein PLH93_09325 [Flavobacteriales bacterium]|nr:hypothetical protein [Flavobacteriales bacterium]HQW87374.1 hypothetical protein [Flavobacteriales bacterium]
MERVSDRVSVNREADRTTVVISARLSRGREALLVAWTLAWLVCGVVLLVEAVRQPRGDLRQYLFVFLAFWTYFLVRVGRSALWRLKGFELWRVKDGVLTIKDSILGYGKATDHALENVQDLDLLERDERSWKWHLNESFWVMGGERLQFSSMGRKVAFGKGLTDAEAARLLAILKHAQLRFRTRQRTA